MSNSGHESADYDLLVIGAGINGAGIARDASGRGIKTLLCEKDDIAQHTSSASTKLIHGGLRYLEHYDFKLVRHALQEREVLLKAAPHIIWPLRFILPHHSELRPKWLIRVGLFLYDYIGGRKILPASHSVNFTTHESGESLQDKYVKGFEYSDCWVQDSRLVVLNVFDAASKGCDVRTRTEVTNLVRRDGLWSATLRDNITGALATVRAKAIVNASGPWVEKTLGLDKAHKTNHAIRLIKGSHIVVPKLYDHPYAYIFQNADNRILFAVPYEGEYTLLGTTDIEVSSDPGPQEIDDAEVEYICKSASEYFRMHIDSSTTVWAYSGVRPLYDDASENASKVTRDYRLDMDTDQAAPMLSVYGGKITTYRKLSEEAVDLLATQLTTTNSAWTEDAHLPGGDIPDADFDAFLGRCLKDYAWLPEDIVTDYARNYGTQIHVLLQDNDVQSIEGLGLDFGGGLYQVEVDYLVNHEWAKCADDILWRRSKKGLRVCEECDAKIYDYLAKHHELVSTDQFKIIKKNRIA